jgi:hypothetical protein
MVKKIFKIVLIVVVVAFIAIQFKRPDRTNPPIDAKQTIEAHQTVPQPVAAIFDRACNDCHSNKTVWPFYSQIAPVSWLVADDVTQGRRHLNFSEWGTYDKKKRVKKLGELCDEVTSGTMPMWQYTLTHRSAKLSPEDMKLLCGWSETEMDAIDNAAEQK